MSTLTIDYQPDGLAAPDNPFRPLTAAARAFLGNVVRVFAVLLSLLSFVLPLALVAGPVAVWIYWVNGTYGRPPAIGLTTKAQRTRSPGWRPSTETHQ